MSEPRKTMTYRALLLWLEREAATREDGELDMPVVLRVDVGDDMHVGNLYDVEVDAGCADEDSLILDGAQDVDEDLGGHPMAGAL